MSGMRIGGIAAAVFIALGALLPWATVDTWIGTFSANGLEGDGKVTLLLGIGTGVLIGLWKRPLVIIGAGLSGLVALIAMANLIDLGRAIGESGFASISPGAGLILTLLAALAAVALAIISQAQLGAQGQAMGLTLTELNRGASLPTTTLPTTTQPIPTLPTTTQPMAGPATPTGAATTPPPPPPSA